MYRLRACVYELNLDLDYVTVRGWFSTRRCRFIIDKWAAGMHKHVYGINEVIYRCRYRNGLIHTYIECLIIWYSNYVDCVDIYEELWKYYIISQIITNKRQSNDVRVLVLLFFQILDYFESSVFGLFCNNGITQQVKVKIVTKQSYI